MRVRAALPVLLLSALALLPPRFAPVQPELLGLGGRW